jgi:hypothetical protein
MGERFIPNPESREAHFSGLLSREDLQRELTRLDGPLTIEFPRYGEHKDVYTAPTSETPRVLSEAEYKDYREDVEQDVKGLQHRLQRLKVRLLSRSLAGSQYRERSDFRSRQEDPFFDVVMTFPSSVKHGDREEYATNEKQPAFSEFNTYVPERYRLHVTQDMSRKELVEIHNLAFAMSVMRPPTPRLKEQLERCLDEIVSLETQMHETTQQGELFAASQASGVSELTYRNVWKTYRELLKEVATLEESGSWI